MTDKEIIHALWVIIDHIDTASDIAKSDESLYRKLVQNQIHTFYNIGKIVWDENIFIIPN